MGLLRLSRFNLRNGATRSFAFVAFSSVAASADTRWVCCCSTVFSCLYCYCPAQPRDPVQTVDRPSGNCHYVVRMRRGRIAASDARLNRTSAVRLRFKSVQRLAAAGVENTRRQATCVLRSPALNERAIERTNERQNTSSRRWQTFVMSDRLELLPLIFRFDVCTSVICSRFAGRWMHSTAAGAGDFTCTMPADYMATKHGMQGATSDRRAAAAVGLGSIRSRDCLSAINWRLWERERTTGAQVSSLNVHTLLGSLYLSLSLSLSIAFGPFNSTDDPSGRRLNANLMKHAVSQKEPLKTQDARQIFMPHEKRRMFSFYGTKCVFLSTNGRTTTAYLCTCIYSIYGTPARHMSLRH
jgi:hypothetical protein